MTNALPLVLCRPLWFYHIRFLRPLVCDKILPLGLGAPPPPAVIAAPAAPIPRLYETLNPEPIL